MKQPWTETILRDREKPREPLSDQARPALTGATLEQAYRELLLQNQLLLDTNQRLQAQLSEVEGRRTAAPIENQLIRDQRNIIAERSHELRQQQYACKMLQRERDHLQQSNSRLAEQSAKLGAEKEALKQQLAAAQTLNGSLQREVAEKNNDLVTLSERHYRLQAELDPTMDTRRVVNVDF